MRGAIALLLLVPTEAAARPTEVVVSAGILSPTPSTYRSTAETLGYDRRGFRHVYEGEVALLHALQWWISIGPVARFYYGDLAPPYEGVPQITTMAGSVGARVEIDLFPYPRLFVWADPSLGIGEVGSRTATFWGLRAGVGIGSTRDAASVRFRIGYATAPTFGVITDASGPFNFGGFMFQLDGVFRVAR